MQNRNDLGRKECVTIVFFFHLCKEGEKGYSDLEQDCFQKLGVTEERPIGVCGLA